VTLVGNAGAEPVMGNGVAMGTIRLAVHLILVRKNKMIPRETPDPTKSLVSIIEDMMISESKRYAELRLLRESLPADQRGPTNDSMGRVRATLDRLSRFRSSLLCQIYVGLSLPAVTSARRVTSRDVLTLLGH
jgi:hypothetical protein